MTTPLKRNFGFMGAGVVGVALVQFVLYFLVARYLGHHEYGGFAIALTMALLAAPLCDLGTNIAMIWSHARDPESLGETVGTSLLARLLLAAPVGGGVILIGRWLGFSDEILWLFVPLFLAAVLDGIAGLFSAVFQAREEMGYSATILLCRNVARAFGLGATLVIGGDLETLAVSWVAASTVSTSIAFTMTLRTVRLRIRPAKLPRILRTAWPFGSAIIANLLLLQSDILMLGHFAGDSAVGLYHAAFRFIVLAELLPHVVSMVIIPRSYRIGHREGAENLSRFYRVQTLVLGTVGLLGSLLVALHGDDLAVLALGAPFAETGVLLTALAPLIFLRFMLVPLGDALSSLGHQRRLSRAAWLACASNVSLNLVLIPAYGALGAALATIGSQICMLLAQMVATAGTGLQPDWWRLLSQPMFAVAAVAILFLLAPATAPFLVPLALVLVFVMFRRAPTDEHQSVLRSARG